MRFYRLILCWLVLVVMVGIPGMTRAQPYEIITVPAAGQTHYMRTDFGTDPYTETIRELLVRSIEIYDPLWAGSSPVIFFDLVPDEDPTSAAGDLVDASAGMLSFEDLSVTIPGVNPADPVCRIRILDVESDYPLDYVVPHEVAHCYQYFNVPIDPLSITAAHFWWMEGSAQWMSDLVSPLPGEIIAPTQDLLIDRGVQSLPLGTYDTFYFWDFMSTTAGSEAVINFLLGMPADAGSHLDYLSTHLGAEVDAQFHAYARAVGLGSLRYLPATDALTATETLDELPGTVEIWAESFGIGAKIIEAPASDDPEEGIEIDIAGLRESGLMVSLLDGTILEEGGVVQICDGSNLATLIYSRTDGGRLEASPPDAATLTVNPTTCDETEIAAVGEDDEADPELGFTPECVVGNWQLVAIPAMNDTGIAISGGLRQVTIEATGAVLDSYNNFQMSMTPAEGPTGLVTVNGSISSRITLDADGVVASVLEMRPSVSVMVEVNSMSMDMSSAANEILGNSGSITNGVQLACAGNSLYITPVGAAGIDGSFVLERMDED